jgi:hypothetical protein
MIRSRRSIADEGKRRDARWQSPFTGPRFGAVPAFYQGVMETLARRRDTNRSAASEVQELQEALDKSYAQWRERARREWQRRCAGVPDPSDACVHVHIATSPRHMLED